MSYHRELLEKLSDSKNCPSFERADFLDELNEVADKYFNQGTLEGYASSLVIYGEICGEMQKLLEACSAFFAQCLLAPEGIKPSMWKGGGLGRLLRKLDKQAISLKTKKFTEKCGHLNKLRLELTEKIKSKTALASIKNEAGAVKRLFDEIFNLFDLIYEHYRVTSKEVKKELEAFETALDGGGESVKE